SARRYEGYLAALAAADQPALPPINGGWTSDSAYAATLRLLNSRTPVTGIVAVTTTTALGVHSGIVEAGQRIPDDISLISVHDTWFARHLNPPLSVVSLPMDQVGTSAVSMLIDQIRHPSVGEVVITDPAPSLITRGSTTRRKSHCERQPLRGASPRPRVGRHGHRRRGVSESGVTASLRAERATRPTVASEATTSTLTPRSSSSSRCKANSSKSEASFPNVTMRSRSEASRSLPRATDPIMCGSVAW